MGSTFYIFSDQENDAQLFLSALKDTDLTPCFMNSSARVKDQFFKNHSQDLFAIRLNQKRDQPGSFFNLSAEIEASIRPNQLFLYSDSSLSEAQDYSKNHIAGHFLKISDTPFFRFYCRHLIIQALKGGYSGLESYSSDPSAKPQTIELKRSEEKAAAIEAMRRVLTRRSLHARVIESIARALDELMMNAIFDAPISDSRIRYRHHFARDLPLSLGDQEKIKLQLLSSDQAVIIKIQDQFGSLSLTRAFEAFSQNFSDQKFHSKEHEQGGNLGLYGIAQSGLSLQFRVKPGEFTEAILIFPSWETYKQSRLDFQALSFFSC